MLAAPVVHREFVSHLIIFELCHELLLRVGQLLRIVHSHVHAVTLSLSSWHAEQASCRRALFRSLRGSRPERLRQEARSHLALLAS